MNPSVNIKHEGERLNMFLKRQLCLRLNSPPTLNEPSQTGNTTSEQGTSVICISMFTTRAFPVGILSRKREQDPSKRFSPIHRMNQKGEVCPYMVANDSFDKLRYGNDTFNLFEMMTYFVL